MNRFELVENIVVFEHSKIPEIEIGNWVLSKKVGYATVQITEEIGSIINATQESGIFLPIYCRINILSRS